MSEREWIELIAPLATAEYSKTEYLPSVLISQTCLENGFGMDESCEILVANHNILGMKASLLNGTWDSVWNGEWFEKVTPEWDGKKTIYIKDKFRKYDSFAQCLHDYCRFMHGEKYNGVTNIKDPYDLISTVSAMGYATDPAYADGVMSIINRFDLTRYDDEVLKRTPAGEKVKAYPIYDHKSYKDADGNITVPRRNKPEAIVPHYLGVDGQNWDLFHQKDGDSGRFGGHATIYWNGDIHERVPADGVVYAVGKGSWELLRTDLTNDNTYSVELCCHNPDGYCPEAESSQPKWWFTQETQEAAVYYIRKKFKDFGWTLDRASVEKRLVCHGHITTKPCPPMWTKYNGVRYNGTWTWEEFKEAVVTGICPQPKEGEYMFECKTVRKGDEGKEVLLLQTILRGRKWKGKDKKLIVRTGVFDETTLYAVEKFQKKFLGEDEVDGIVGKKTWAKLIEL